MHTTVIAGRATLIAKRHHLAPELIVVTTGTLAWGEGNVVARYHEPSKTLTRTKHSGPKPALAEIRAAIAQVTRG